MKFISEAGNVAHTLTELKTLLEDGLALLSGPVSFQIPIDIDNIKEEDTPASVTLTPKEVYEANKTCNFCVNCGKPTETKMLLSSSIKYCPCTDQS